MFIECVYAFNSINEWKFVIYTVELRQYVTKQDETRKMKEERQKDILNRSWSLDKKGTGSLNN